MARAARASIRFDDLPLFVARDADLAEAIVGSDPERKQIWLAGLPRLEASGFPKFSPGQGRYRPAVKAYYDRFYAIEDIRPTRVVNATEDGVWTNGRTRRRA